MLERDRSNIVALGLGGNLGDPRQTMAHALRFLDAEPGCDVQTVSRLYRTPPWGLTEQPVFINCCALIETTLEPADLMRLCLDIEKRLKRVRKVRWGPRLVDIDILTFSDLTLTTELITVPHPRLTERGFVLVPLAEIAPDLMVQSRRILDWLAVVDQQGIAPVSDDGLWWTRDAT